MRELLAVRTQAYDLNNVLCCILPCLFVIVELQQVRHLLVRHCSVRFQVALHVLVDSFLVDM